MIDLRKDFNLGDEVYLDTAATSKTPKVVLEAMIDYYRNYRATVHRGVYSKAQKATQTYELSRQKIAQFINAKVDEIVFTRNATESINLVVQTWGRQNLGKGDKVVLTIMEHHSNILPWLELCQELGCKIEYVGLTKDYRLDLDELYKKCADARCFSLTHVSNVLGVVNPIKQIIKKLRTENRELKIVVDGAQAVGHIPINVAELGCDFYVFSGHKMYGPTGIGVLWGRRELLKVMPPYQTGGEMNKNVTTAGAIWNEVPWKFEAGTPNIAGAIGLGAAVDYINSVGIERIMNHESRIMDYMFELLKAHKSLKLFGPRETKDRTGVFSFLIKGQDSVKLAEFLDQKNISIRSGRLCAEPLLTSLGVKTLDRVSLGVYNTNEDIDKLMKILHEKAAQDSKTKTSKSAKDYWSEVI